MVEHWTPTERALLDVKPGITGPTQLLYTRLEEDDLRDVQDVEARYLEQHLHAKARLDLEYLATRTWRSDAEMVVRTMAHMASRALRPRAGLRAGGPRPR